MPTKSSTSFERSEQFLPASLPHGDAGATTGNGSGLIRAQSLALNDTHSFSPRWLNEARFGLNRFGLVFSPIDFGTKLADKVGIPGVNISDTTSAMTQITFGGGDVRNLSQYYGFNDRISSLRPVRGGWGW